jgi:IS5 family transposase
LSLLNEAREFSELIIDTLCANLSVDQKPRTYREKARKAYLAIAKQSVPVPKRCAEASNNNCSFFAAT